jgi:hypothetical protein
MQSSTERINSPDKEKHMPTYRLLSAHSRMTPGTEGFRELSNGGTVPVFTPGPVIRFEAGDLIEPTAAELAAFGDRLEWVSDDPLTLRVLPATATRLNPELFTLIRRAHAGEATADELNIVADVTRYLEAHAQGTASHEETAALELVLKEFGMPLFVV